MKAFMVSFGIFRIIHDSISVVYWISFSLQIKGCFYLSQILLISFAVHRNLVGIRCGTKKEGLIKTAERQ